MDYQTLDFYFPFLIFFYGLIMTFVLNTPVLIEIAEKKFPPRLLSQLKSHRFLGVVCLCLGTFWSLQNIWL